MSNHVIRASRSHRLRLAGDTHPCLYLPNGASVNLGDHASLQDLPAGADGLTIDLWVYHLARTSSVSWISKQPTDAGYYFMRYYNVGGDYNAPRVLISYDADDALRNGSTGIPYAIWQHYAMEWTEFRLRIWDHGVFTRNQEDGAGNYNSDVGEDMIACSNMNGYLGWLRFSKAARFAASNFTPPPRWPPPEVDADTIEQWNVDDMTGTTLTAQVNANNHGTISNGSWIRA